MTHDLQVTSIAAKPPLADGGSYGCHNHQRRELTPAEKPANFDRAAQQPRVEPKPARGRGQRQFGPLDGSAPQLQTADNRDKGDQQGACLLACVRRRQSDEDTRGQSDRDKDQGEAQIQRAFNDFHTFTFLESVFTFREIARETPCRASRPVFSQHPGSAPPSGGLSRMLREILLEIRRRVAYSTGQST